MVDLRSIDELPSTETIEDLRVLSPLELIVSKVVSYHARRGKPKSGTDWRDIAVLILKFPELKQDVEATLEQRNCGIDILKTWSEIASQSFEIEGDDDLSF